MFDSFSSAATNAIAQTNAGFAASAAWSYTTPASHYFWAGFIFVFFAGMFGLTLRWIRRILKPSE